MASEAQKSGGSDVDYWHTLQQYAVSSEPGQNLVEEALSVLMGRHGNIGLVGTQLFSRM
jgi:hypothetical protein